MDLLLERFHGQPLTKPIEWLSTPQGARQLTIHAGCDRSLLAETVPAFDLLPTPATGQQGFVEPLARPRRDSHDVAGVTFGKPNPVTLLFAELISCPLN